MPFERGLRTPFDGVRSDREVRPKVATEGDTLFSEPSVLIVDRSTETREVLKTALERRGWRILAASRAQRGLELAKQHHPDLIVLDPEASGSDPEAICAPFAEEAEASHTPLVVLGSGRGGPRGLVHGEFISKPYHYGPLIRRIEELLGATGRAGARSA